MQDDEPVGRENPEDKEKPLLVDCLLGIEQSIFNVLIRLRDYYDLTNVESQERERTYIFMLHKELNTAIIVSRNIKKTEVRSFIF